MKPKKYQARVISIVNYGKRSSLYRLSVSNEFSFEPGQFVMVILKDKEGKEARRAYSIASSPNEKGHIELLVTRIEGGIASEFFKRLKAGDSFEILGPMGVFKIREKLSDPTYFVATGCGIAPFISMIRSLLEKGVKSRIILLYGFRHEVDYLCKEYVEGMLENYPNFSVISVMSQPKGKWKGYVGRVTSFIDIAIEPKEDTQVYICGQKEMIGVVAEELMKRGAKKENIIFERWF
ncbi:MAG TPA: FAD-binding oxidoreductase [Candidatus Nanoarchaeia archaeon]|nr:FAD-binding oxidoreductase [Candidatus Nanoarchaeia archaeon]